MIRRLTYLAAYGALAALGEALVARPALLWVRSLGLFRSVLAWDVPFGALLLCCAVAVALFTFGFALGAARGRVPGAPMHVAFLLLVAICFTVRRASGNPRPPRDPAPALLQALRAAGAELDRAWNGVYAPDAVEFAAPLAQVPPPEFRRLGRPLPLHARILSGSGAPQLTALAGDEPGTIYVCISNDRQVAWLTALGLAGVLRLPSGKPAIVTSHRGTHTLPGNDPDLPEYPGQ